MTRSGWDRDPKRLGCAFDGCDRPHEARGYCSGHYYQLRTGKPLRTLRPTDTRERLRTMWTEGANGCWEWAGRVEPSGYGMTRIPGKQVVAHRAVYEVEVGPIPEGAELDHICHNRACVNPSHLRPVTRKQNMENRAGANRNSKSGILGVSYVPRDDRWVAQVTHNRETHTSYHTSKEEAAEAVVEMRRRFFTHNELDHVTPDSVFTVLDERKNDD